MGISYTIKAAAILSLLAFSFYMAEQNKHDATRKKWKNILSMITLTFFAGKIIEEFNLF